MSFQERADAALEPIGVSCPAPMLGEPLPVYRRRVLELMALKLPRDHELRCIPYSRCDDAALRALEPQVFEAIRGLPYDTRTLRPGEEREIPIRMPDGMKMTTFVMGEGDSFIKGMGRPCRKVVSFATDKGPMDASGRFLR
jgi:hypothetical protein